MSKLRIRKAFAGNGDEEDKYRQSILDAQTRHGIPGCKITDSASGILTRACFCSSQNICRGASDTPFALQFGIARVVGNAVRSAARCEDRAEATKGKQGVLRGLSSRHGPDGKRAPTQPTAPKPNVHVASTQPEFRVPRQANQLRS